MASLQRPLIRLALLLAPVTACEPSLDSLQHGRLDLVITPSDVAASSQVLHGRFSIVALHRNVREHLEVHAVAPHTVSAWLRPGAYLFEWQPAVVETAAVDLEVLEDSAAATRATEPHVVLIMDSRITTARVWATSRPSHPEMLDGAIAGILGR